MSMKTLVSKTEIRKAIYNQEVSTLYKYANQLNLRVENLVCDYVKVSRKSASDCIWAIARAKHSFERWQLERDDKSAAKIFNLKHKIIDYLKEQIGQPVNNYSKAAMRGFTHLYFCSPVYGHSDYNKWCTGLPIEGNEAFVDKVIAISNKHFK